MKEIDLKSFANALADKMEKKADNLRATNDFAEECDQSFAAEIQHDTLKAVAGAVRELLGTTYG